MLSVQSRGCFSSRQCASGRLAEMDGRGKLWSCRRPREASGRLARWRLEGRAECKLSAGAYSGKIKRPRTVVNRDGDLDLADLVELLLAYGSELAFGLEPAGPLDAHDADAAVIVADADANSLAATPGRAGLAGRRHERRSEVRRVRDEERVVDRGWVRQPGVYRRRRQVRGPSEGQERELRLWTGDRDVLKAAREGGQTEGNVARQAPSLRVRLRARRAARHAKRRRTQS